MRRRSDDVILVGVLVWCVRGICVPCAPCGCSCSCKLLQSGTSIVTDLKIDGYSLAKGTPTGDYLESDTLTVGGHSWRIRFFPNGAKSEDEGFISVFLHLDGRVVDMVKA